MSRRWSPNLLAPAPQMRPPRRRSLTWPLVWAAAWVAVAAFLAMRVV
jgi:hypothetical protein